MSRKRNLLRRAGLLLAGLALGCGVLELGVRAYVEGGLAPGLASLFGGKLFREVRAAESAYATHPELGYTLSPRRPGVHPLGFRHGPIEQPKPAGRTRVIVVGDSVAFDGPGDGELGDEGGFVDRLRAAWGVELINASIPGYTSYQERLLFERRLVDLEPDLVLLQYCLNDNHRFLHRITPDGQRLLTPEAKRALIPEGDGPLDRFARWSYLLVELRRRTRLPDPDSETFGWEQREDLAPAWREASWGAVEDNLRAMRDLCAERGAAFAVVAFPIEQQLSAAALADVPTRARTLRPQALLGEACERLELPLLDLVPAFEAAGDPSALFRDGLHLSARGHALAAERIEAFAAERGLR